MNERKTNKTRLAPPRATRRFLIRSLFAASIGAASAAAAAQTAVVDVNLPAGALSQSLNALARQSGTPILVEASVVAGRSAAAVSGRMTVMQAVQALLAGTRLAAQEQRGAIVVRPAGEDAATLETVTVTGAGVAENAWGPAPGLVASRSATGTKTDTSILENPQSVSVVTRKEMDARNVQTVTEAIQYTPGVSVDQLGMDNQIEWISLRGFSSPSSYLDGLRLGPIWQSEPFGLERVEVLRGPASVLYGESGPGGLTGMISKRPSAERAGEVQLQAGNQDRFQGAVDLTGPVGETDEWLYRVVALQRDSNTAVDYVKNDRVFLAPSLTWQPSAATRLTLLTQYQRDKIGFLPQYLPADGTLHDNPHGSVPRSRYVGEPDREHYLRDQTAVGYSLEHSFNDTFSLQQNARYTRVHQEFDTVTGNGLLPDRRTLRRRLFDADQTSYDINVDTTLTSRFATGALTHTLLTGVEYSRQRYDSLNWICGTAECAPPIDLFNPVYGQTIQRPDLPVTDALQHQERLGVYAQDQIRLGRWAYTLGGRWDRVRQSMMDRLSDTTTRSADHAFTARVGAAYLFDNGVTPYASYSESFQPTSGLIYPSSPAKPTTGRQYEVGVKYEPAGHNSFVGVALFEVAQRNMATTDPVNPGFIVQSAETRVRGVELEGKLELSRQLSVLASYTYTDAEYKRSNDGYEGNQVSITPRSQASAWVDYAFTDALAGLSAGAGVRYVGKRYGNASNTIELASYTLVDAALRYDLRTFGGQWRNASVALNVNNLFDKDYVGVCLSNTRCYFGAPRTVMATVTYRW
ncbi:TonB-dependent siderophore receptor [Achromobacter marplatensis]|uniref:TonB-dependent siderophore receptor n=1 Tax=Achromobacter marplatensis TaxID=470868 RepID=UPI000277F409|nr:TonB-dependent siderophore receptor [Achromobacter marplatensis]EJO29070.1 iron uptake receptor [Achromobacter marplatensis]